MIYAVRTPDGTYETDNLDLAIMVCACYPRGCACVIFA